MIISMEDAWGKEGHSEGLAGPLTSTEAAMI